MILPRLDEPTRYRGLYVFDFGEWCAVGYTALEIETLLESEQYRSGKVYRIHRAWPDGRMELRGVSSDRFQLESGMFFTRADAAAARRDFEHLAAAAEANPPPGRMKLHLAHRAGGCQSPSDCVTAMIYPAEYEEEMSEWLTKIGFDGGDTAEGGVSHVTDYLRQNVHVIDRRQFWGTSSAQRTRDEILCSVRRAVQR